MNGVAAPTVDNAPAAVLGQLAALGVLPQGVEDDSRQVRPGDLFVASPWYFDFGQKTALTEADAGKAGGQAEWRKMVG